MALLDVNSFGKGKYELHKGMFENARIEDYIERYEPRYLTDLLGAALYDEFKADLVVGGGIPSEQRFIKIFEQLSVDLSSCVVYSEGIVEMLKGFVYFEFMKDKVSQPSSLGNLIPEGENSQVPNTLKNMMYTRYNEAVRSYRTIQTWIAKNLNDYSNFNGNEKEFTHWL